MGYEPNLQRTKSGSVISLYKKNFSGTKMLKKPQSPLSTQTTPREEFEYIWMTLRELLRILSSRYFPYPRAGRNSHASDGTA